MAIINNTTIFGINGYPNDKLDFVISDMYLNVEKLKEALNNIDSKYIDDNGQVRVQLKSSKLAKQGSPPYYMAINKYYYEQKQKEQFNTPVAKPITASQHSPDREPDFLK